MKTVHEYPLQFTNSQIIDISDLGSILTAHMQHGVPTLWIEVNSTSKTEQRKIRMFGTGHEMIFASWYKFIGMVFDETGCVWHIYEEGV